MNQIASLFLKYRNSLILLVLFIYGLINAWVSSVSTVADFSRTVIPLSAWEAYTWSFSSFIMTFVLVFYILKVQSIHPLSHGKFKKHIVFHFFHSLIFSIVHVVGMVIIRKIIYQYHNGYYDFGHWPTEFIYEYRKDIVTYFMILAGIYIYQALIEKYKSETNNLPPQDTNTIKKTDKLLIKKKGKEYIIDLNEVSTIESGGNYIYLNSNNNVYPMRSTMNKMQQSLDANKFIRVHRSYIVNIDYIKEIITLSNQDYQIVLKDNKNIPLSRNYRSLLLDRF